MRREKQRLMAITGTAQEMYCQQKDIFLLDNARDQRQVGFDRDASGKVASLSFVNGEQRMVCKKVQ